LGEFYTNEDIVNEILSHTGYNADSINVKENNKILLDPSCGSGSFLVGAISIWSNKIKNSLQSPNKMAEILRYLTDNIVGIDIHPFAVAMARVNYLLAILDLLTPPVIQILGEIRIPIYWSDSLVKSEEVMVSPIIDIKIPKLGDFQFPDYRSTSYLTILLITVFIYSD
jgi:N-6 DNA Methylase